MELDFPNDVVEKLMLKRALTDKHWLGILSKTFDMRWFKDVCIGPVLKSMVAFY